MPVFSCGRSLYIDLHTVVVVGGNVLYHVKREGELSGREGKMSRGGISHTLSCNMHKRSKKLGLIDRQTSCECLLVLVDDTSKQMTRSRSCT